MSKILKEKNVESNRSSALSQTKKDILENYTEAELKKFLKIIKKELKK